MAQERDALRAAVMSRCGRITSRGLSWENTAQRYQAVAMSDVSGIEMTRRRLWGGTPRNGGRRAKATHADDIRGHPTALATQDQKALPCHAASRVAAVKDGRLT